LSHPDHFGALVLLNVMQLLPKRRNERTGLLTNIIIKEKRVKIIPL